MKPYMKPLHAEVRRLLAEIGERQIRISWAINFFGKDAWINGGSPTDGVLLYA